MYDALLLQFCAEDIKVIVCTYEDAHSQQRQLAFIYFNM